MLAHRWLVFALAAVLVAVCLARPGEARAYDYVVNGSFEDGTEGWTPGPSTSFSAVSEGDGTIARLELTNATFMIRQTSVLGTPAGTYDLSLRIRLESRTTYVYAEVSANPNFAVYWTADAPAVEDEWIDISGQVQVTGYTNIVFKVGGSGAIGDVVYVDDFRFAGAPPATMTPTSTHTATETAIPPSATKTPKPTNTPKPTRTPAPEATESDQSEAVPPPTGADGVLNGGFEEVADGGPVAWEKYGGSLSAATSPVRSGSRAARLESTTASTKWLYQTTKVSGGSAYSFEAWLWHDDPGVESAFLRVSWYASADGSGTAIGSADSLTRLDAQAAEWRRLATGAILAPPEAVTAKVRVMLAPGGTGRAAIYVDDVWFGIADAAEVAQLAAAQPAAGRGEASQRGAQTRASSRAVARAGAATAPASTDATILISEVLYDSVGEGDDAGGEFVELYNPGDVPVSLEGWALADDASIERFDAVTILPREFLLLIASDSRIAASADVAVVEGRLGNGLGNNGDVLVLFDPGGRYVDAVSWGDDTAAMRPPIADVPAGHSIERVRLDQDTGEASDFVDNESPTPGEPYRSPDVDGGTIRSPKVEVLEGDGAPAFGWLPWALAAASMAGLAGVASWRIGPALADRLRHQ